LQAILATRYSRLTASAKTVFSSAFGIIEEKTMAAQTPPSAVLTYEQLLVSLRETDRIVKETALQMKETDRKMQETDRIVKETALQMKETDRKMQETDRKMQETDRQIKVTNKKISELGDRIGEIVEVMVEGGAVRKFQELGYPFTQCARRVEFENKELEISGELDLFLENGDCALAVEVKTNFTMRDVQDHVKRLEKFSRYARTKGDQRRFMAAVGGAVIRREVQEYALKRGIYVIIQSGDAVEIVTLPKGFKAKIW
jgi:chromosome segregation ATPase